MPDNEQERPVLITEELRERIRARIRERREHNRNIAVRKFE